MLPLQCRSSLSLSRLLSGFRPYPFPGVDPSQGSSCNYFCCELLASVLSGVRPFTVCTRLLWPRLTTVGLDIASQRCLPLAGPQFSQGKARDFPLVYLPHIQSFGPDDHRVKRFGPPRPPTELPQYAIRIPQAKSLPAASFPPRLTATQLLFS